MNLHELAACSEDTLYSIIAHEVHDEGELGALPFSHDQAKAWVKEKMAEIRARLCGNKVVRSLMLSGFSMELVAAVAALLESLSLGSAATPVAVLLCKQGLKKVCDGEK